MKRAVLNAIVGIIGAIGATVVQAAPTACPARSGDARLAQVTVYDGPLADNASLAPDTTRTARGVTVQQWRVDYVYRAGRRINLSCAYDSKPPAVVPVAAPAKLCRYVWGRTAARASCG